MERDSVDSSNLVSVGYDLPAQYLEIEFKRGAVYGYSGVPRSVYLGLMMAISKGGYHAANIKWLFAYSRGEYSPAPAGAPAPAPAGAPARDYEGKYYG
jgi:hypothetical protein